MQLEERRGLDANEVVARLAAQLVRLDPGDLAQLRRMDPQGPGEAAFWRLQAQLGFPATTLWQTLVRLMALLTPRGDPSLPKRLHLPDRRLGKALARSGYPEARLLRLMALPAERRSEPLERIARWLAAKDEGRGVSCTDLYWLLASNDVRNTRDLAASYYAAEYSQDAEPNADKEPAA